MPKPVKVEAVKEISAKFKGAQVAFFLNNKGMTVPAVTDLRKKLRDLGGVYKVYKNSLIQHAANELKYTGLEKYLTGPTAIVFSNEPVAPAKVLAAFAKENTALEIKAALYEKNVSDSSLVRKFATLLSREQTLTQFVCLLNSPLSGFARVIDALRVQKEKAGEWQK